MLINPVFGHCRRLWPSVAIAQKRFISKDYDKIKKLLPERIEYKYGDSKFFNEHRLQDEPYLKLTDDEIVEFSKVKLEKDYKDRHFIHIDINEEPYRQVLVGNPDDKGFTQAETVADKSRWYWVERLLPKQEIPRMELTDPPVTYPSGWSPPPKTKPDLPYFVGRARGHLLPVYRQYQVEGRNRKTYWKNRWDSKINHWNKEILDKIDEVKWPSNETTLTLTLVRRIKGDIWQLEEDLRSELESKHKRRILSAVQEVNGMITLKGDHVMDCVNWLIKTGF